MDPADVVEFLLLSRTFPRSVLFCLRAAEHDLARLDRRRRAHPPAAHPRSHPVRARVLSTSRELLHGGLHGFLDRMQEGVRQVRRGGRRAVLPEPAGVDLHALESQARRPRRGLRPMRLDIRYRTRFDYDDARPRVAERAAGRARERRAPAAHLLSGHHARRLRACFSFTDYWGTRVDAFGVREPHEALEVIAEAVGRDAAGRRSSPCRRTSTSLRGAAVPRRAPRVPPADRRTRIGARPSPTRRAASSRPRATTS